MAAPVVPVISVDVWSDLACPWCYVGKKRLEAAVQKYGNKATVRVKWHPYMIDPKTASTGEEYLAYNKRRWGYDSWTHELRKAGKPDGALFADWRWWPHTLAAHRLVLLADREGRSEDAVQALFSTIYEEGGNASDTATLAAVGERLGLPGAAAYLAGQEGLKEVLREDATAKEGMDIHGVPYFVIGLRDSEERFALEGAQSADTFLQVFDASLAKASTSDDA